MPRCRFSKKGLEWLTPRKNADREGELIRVQRGGETVLVKWDALKSKHQYHKNFIEIIHDPVSEIDPTNAPVLREILGIAPNTIHPIWDR
jgi:hypothetical protein